MTTVFLRRGIQYQASSAILCKAGSDLGNTMHGHHDFQLTDDVLHKVHIGHYTFYSKAVVKNPKMMIRAPGVFSRRYLGGEDMDNVKTLTAVDGTTFKDVMHRDEFQSGTDSNDPGDLQGGSLYRSGNAFVNGTGTNNYFIRGTCYTDDKKTINSLGFGEHTYPGCRYAREGRGVALKGLQMTLESMK